MFVTKLLFVCAAVVLVSGRILDLQGPRELSGNEIETDRVKLENYLSRIAAGNPGKNYRPLKILTAIDLGDNVKMYTLELIDSDNVTKTCDVNTYTRTYIPKGVQVEFKCPNEPIVMW